MEKHVYELVRELMRYGVAVDIVCEDRAFLPDASNPHAEHIIGVPSDSLHADGDIARFVEKSRRFCELVDPMRYDIIHSHGQFGFHTALRLARIDSRPPFVSTFHLTALGPAERYRQLGLPEPEESAVERAAGLMEAAIARLADCCFGVSRVVVREIEQFYGVPSASVLLTYNWYDPRIFWPHDRLTARQVLGLRADGRYLLYIGHFKMARGKILIDVLRLLPRDVKLLVVHHERDEEVLAEFDGRLEYTGHLSAERLALHYSAADLLCFPALYGGFGLVLLEAMACGCPPVVFDFPAMNELVTEDSGYLVVAPTPAAYAAAIERALADRERKRSAAAERARVFDMERQISALVAAYKDLVELRKYRLDPAREMVQRIFDISVPVPNLLSRHTAD